MTTESSSGTLAADPESTQVLLDRAQAGDARALDDLVERYVAPLTRFAHGRLPSWARGVLETGDLVQDTLLRTVRSLEGLESRGSGSFHAYLRTAVLNRVRDEKRRHAERVPDATLEDNQQDASPSALEEAIGRQEIDRYEAALERLSVRDREAIHTRIELGLPYAMVAEAIGVPSADAARMAVSRALVKLAKEMA